MAKEGIRRIEGKRGVSYRAFVDGPRKNGKRNQLSETFKTEAEAVSWRIKTLREVDTGAWVDEVDYDLKTVFELYIQARVAVGEIGANTIASQRSTMRTQFHTLLDLPVRGIKPQMIEACLARERARGMSSRTLAKAFGLVRSLFTWMVDRGELARNPTNGMRAPKGEDPFVTPGTWSLDELRLFLLKNAESREFALWVTLLGSGLRRGEAQALTWEDVLFEDAMLRVAVSATREIGPDGVTYKTVGKRTKTPKGRRLVPLMADVAAVLKAHKGKMKREAVLLGLGWSEQRFVFPNETGTAMLTDKQLELRLDKAIAHAGVRRLTPHGLRHTFVSRVLGEGVPLAIVMEWVGHTKAQTTMKYTHPNRLEHGVQMARMDAAFQLLPRPVELDEFRHTSSPES